jgi:hypothetical protein
MFSKSIIIQFAQFSVLLVSTLSATSSFAVVATKAQYLNPKTAPLSVCYIKIWSQGSDDTMTGQPTSACTGTMIETNRVLTAAHCIDSLKTAARSSVVCGNNDKEFSVQGYAVNPDYFSNKFGENRHDVALLDISGSDKQGKGYIAPMALATTEAEVTEALQNPSQCELWGYGRGDDSADDNSWGTLRGAVITYFSPSEMESVLDTTPNPQEIDLSPVHAAPGDSGGPIICKKADGTLIQIATTMDKEVHLDGPEKGFIYSAHEALSYNVDWIQSEMTLPKLPNRL